MPVEPEAVIKDMAEGVTVISAEQVSPLRYSEIDVELNANQLEAITCLSKIYENEGFVTDSLNYINTEEFLLFYFKTQDNMVVKVNFANDKHYIMVPLPFELVTKNIGQIFEYIDFDSETKIFIDTPKDIYKLARLIVKILNRISV